MANIEYFANEVKTEQDAVQDRTATSAKIQPASCIRAGHGIPVHLGRGVRIELLASPKEGSYCVVKATLHPGEAVPLHAIATPKTSICSLAKLKRLSKRNMGWAG